MKNLNAFLELFNSIPLLETEEKKPSLLQNKFHVSERGYVIEPGAVWAKDSIDSYFENSILSAKDLNKTFYRAWSNLSDLDEKQIFSDQVCHYLSTYGSNFEKETYIPNDAFNKINLDLEQFPKGIKVIIIKAISKEELTEKCLDIFRSGIALKTETINLVFEGLEELKYSFTGEEGIKNKEVLTILANKYGILPKEPQEFLRFIISKASQGSITLLIKSSDTLEFLKSMLRLKEKEEIEELESLFVRKGLENLATIFNRFKPIFLCFKIIMPSTINRIAKLSKKHHKAMVINPLNVVTSVRLSEKDTHWLDNSTTFFLFKALNVCHSRFKGKDSFLYSIRNGKSWIKIDKTSNNSLVVSIANYFFILKYLISRIDLPNKTIYIPENVEYALPTSEKLFVGPLPEGSRFTAEKLAVGVYWENSWGARDLDLALLSNNYKVGWNGSYNQNGVFYSGDITNAPNGAVEYVHTQGVMEEAMVLTLNIFSGSPDTKYKLVIGEGADIGMSYMMDPSKVFYETQVSTNQASNLLGVLYHENNKHHFYVMNAGSGNGRVSFTGVLMDNYLESLKQSSEKSLYLSDFLSEIGYTVIRDLKELTLPEDPLMEPVQYLDLSLDKLTPSTFIEMFSKK